MRKRVNLQLMSTFRSLSWNSSFLLAAMMEDWCEVTCGAAFS